MIQRLFCLVTVCLLTLNISAQEKEKAEVPYIEVIGTAEKKVMPDEIYISIFLRERPSGKEKISLEAQEQQMKTALKGIGVDMNELSLTDANADYVKIKWGSREVVSSKNYVLLVHTGAMVKKVFEELDKMGVTDASIRRVSHSKIDSLRAATRIDAIKAAKAKADYLLAAIGEQTGKAQIVREEEGLIRNNVNQAYMLNAMETVRFSQPVVSDVDESIGFEKITINSSIYVKFQIK